MCSGSSVKFRKPLSIEGLYYSHGLVCASYPGTVVTLVGIIVIGCSLPFFVTLSGEPNSPKPWRSPWLNYRTTTPASFEGGKEGPQWIIDNPSQSSGRIPSWFLGLPVAVVQQLHVNVEVNCSSMPELCLRSRYTTSKLAAANLLSRMEHVNKLCRSVVHPAALNLTHSLTSSIVPPSSTQPHLSYPRHDPSPLGGILSPMLDSMKIQWGATGNNEGGSDEEGEGESKRETLGHQSLKELLYGGFWEHEHHTSTPSHASHLSQGHAHPLPAMKRHMFAVTFVLQASREQFSDLTSCVEAINTVWPHPHRPRLSFMKHFFYEPDWSLMDFSPLLAVYCIVFLYISFSVGKIDLVKSKIGLGFTACLTVVAALTMSLGICTFFGLSIFLSGSEIYPYVVITMGLENILIIVKAVMSTPEELDVKYRIAVGLSKEGWAITRNLFTLAAMILLGIATLNYAMKEFCIIALVGLMCDFFLQLVFFPTVLAIDLRRLELSDLSSTPIPLPDEVERRGPNGRDDSCCPKSLRLATPTRWRSKRVKFAYFLARARIVSKGLMAFILVCLVAWFSKTETCHRLMAHLFQTDMATLSDAPSPLDLPLPPLVTPPIHHDELLKNMDPVVPAVTVDNQTPPHLQLLQNRDLPTSNIDKTKRVVNERGDPTVAASDHFTDSASSLNNSEVRIVRLRRDGFGVRCDGGVACWRPMVTTHWPRLLRQFGYFVDSRFLTLLPPISLNFQVGYSTAPPISPPPSLVARVVAHPNTIRIAFLVALATIVVFYSALLVHQSRQRHQRYLQSCKVKNSYNKMACLKGHTQDIDCLCVAGGLVVTTGLDGQIRVWDAHPMKRRCITTINRSDYCGEPPPDVSSHRPAAEGCEAEEEVNTPGASTPMFSIPMQKGGSQPGSVSDYPIQSSWEHMMQSRRGHATFPRTGSGAEPRAPARGEDKGPGLRQRHGQMGHVTDQNAQMGSANTKGHTPLPSSPPPSPLTSIPRKKHSDNSKPINVAVYSAPLSPHVEENSPKSNRPSPPTGNSQTFGLQNVGNQFMSPSQVPDHTPFAPCQTPSGLGYEQTATPTVMHQSYQLSPPPSRRPHPQPSSRNGHSHQPILRTSSMGSRTSSTSSTGSRPDFEVQRSHRRTPSSGYGAHIPSSVAMVMHQYGYGSSNQSEVGAPPPFGKQLSTPTFQGHTPSPRPHADQDDHLTSSFSSPTLPSRSQHPPLGHAHNIPGPSHSHQQSVSFHQSVTIASSPQISHAELTAVDVEAQPTPEMMLHRQPVAMLSGPSEAIPGMGMGSTPGMGMGSSHNMSYSHSNTQNLSSSGAMSYSDSNSRKTSESRVPQIQVDPIPSTLVTSSTNTKPTAAVNEGGSSSSSSPLRRKRMGHCRHLSLGNNIPRQQRPTHSRNRSLGSVNFNHILPPSTLSSRQESFGNISLISQASSRTGSRISLTSGFLSEAQVPQTPDPENGYDFVQHFNLFSQYTSNMALEYCAVRRESSAHKPTTTPPVWCMDVWNRIIVVGCGNGQIEAWHADTGSLIFSLNMSNSGVSSIAINSSGVVSGHMDGTLNLIGHNGILRFTVPAHSRPISILRCHGDKVVTGGYDGVVMVHRLTDMVCVNSVFVHKGHVTAVTVVEPSGCVSGCSEGHIVHWDIVSGNCVHDLGEYRVAVMKLESTGGGATVGLLAENTMVVWDNCNGDTLYTMDMDGLCCDFAVLSEKYIAACLESHIVLYNLENGQKHSEKQLESERGVSFLRHILPLQDGASVVCSSGKDVHIVPCQLKLKTD